MKKKNIKSILLIAFAVIAVYVGCMPTGVAVYDLSQSPEPFRCSYFNLVEGVTGGICLPAAALCACIILLTAGLYLTMKKVGMISAVKILSMASAILAVVPVLMRDPAIQLVPNMLLPIAMLCEYAVAYYMEKKEKKSAAPTLAGKLKK